MRALLASHKTDQIAAATETLLTSPYPKRPEPATSPPAPPVSKSSLNTVDLRDSRPPTYSSATDDSAALVSKKTEKPSPKGFLDSLKSFRRTSSSSPSMGLSKTNSSNHKGMMPSPLTPSLPSSSSGGGLSSSQDSTVTPSANIRANVERAVNASRPNRGNQVISEQSIQSVKESSDGYCDVSGAHTNLTYVSDEPITNIQVSIAAYSLPFIQSRCHISSCLTSSICSAPSYPHQFYVDRSIEDPRALMRLHMPSIGRFAERIILPLAAIYKLDPASLHMFYDQVGPLIAFNKGGSRELIPFCYCSAEDQRGELQRLEFPLLTIFATLCQSSSISDSTYHGTMKMFPKDQSLML